MTVAVLTIGTELVRGEIVDTNASFLAEALTGLGHEVAEICTTSDDPEALVGALRRLGAEHTAVVSTGGLGPTTDDRTTECVARVLGVPLERDGASLRAITERMARAGREMATSNAKQADFPRGARVLPNPHGTAPGFAVKLDRAEAFFLPGVPREMKPMFSEHVAPALPAPHGPRTSQILIRVFGLPESTVNDRLAGVESDQRVELAYRAHLPEIEVKVRACAEVEADARRAARRAADEVISRLGSDVAYGEGETALPAVVGQLLVERGLTLGVAESCTGGLVGKLLTDASGSTAFFVGGAITYSNELKQRLLGVDPQLLARHGAVSPEVARAMAEGARARLGADVAVSLTGVAGPTGGTEDKPVGLVHFAVATEAGCTASQINHPGTRDQIRLRAAFAALSLVRGVLRSETDQDR